MEWVCPLQPLKAAVRHVTAVSTHSPLHSQHYCVRSACCCVLRTVVLAETDFTSLPPPKKNVLKSQVNFFSCQIKVNLQKQFHVQSKRVCSRMDSCVGMESEFKGRSVITLDIKGRPVNPTLSSASPRCCADSFYLQYTLSALLPAVPAGEAASAQGPLLSSV